MHSWVIFTVLVGCVAAQNRYRPPPPNPGSGQHIAILRQDSVLNPDGSYQWSYEAENGISAQEQGQLKNVAGSNEPGIDAQGSFQYTAPDGTPISLTYRADENGFQPSGAHLPVPPPIPEAIARSLAWNAAHPEEENQPAGRRF